MSNCAQPIKFLEGVLTAKWFELIASFVFVRSLVFSLFFCLDA